MADRPNIIMILTDQQRTLQHWPAAWQQQNLPSMARLQKHGLTFTHSFTTACACSSSRGSLLTGTYAPVHGVLNTIQLPGDTILGATPMYDLRPTDPNLAHILRAAGYTAVWKGKWHLSRPVGGADKWTTADIEHMEKAYGFARWNPNDAGDSEDLASTLGGGTVGGNDVRYTTGQRLSGDDSPPGESAVEFIRRWNRDDGPLFLVVSLVNPHDIWVAPDFDPEDGYDPELGDIFDLPVPDNVDERLALKPQAQEAFRLMMNGQSAVFQASAQDESVREGRRRYVNFYAYLQTLVDQQITTVLDALDEAGLTDSSIIIRTADHGEMGLSHGLREKEFVAYDEVIRVPLIISSPKLFPKPRVTHAMVGNVDIAPTVARLAGVHDHFAACFQGHDLTPLFRDPGASVRDAIHFVTDDASASLPSADIPPFIRAIRTRDWMYSAYYLTDGSNYEYELYDLNADPDQNHNLAGTTDAQQAQYDLHAKLEAQMRELRTVPPGLLLQTAELTALHDGGGTTTYPLWDTPEEAWSRAADYRANALSAPSEASSGDSSSDTSSD